MTKHDPRPIELDGRTGEGGGQLVRVACALAAVTTQPIRITHVRGNRGEGGPRGGGLKSQHVTALEYLAQATNADTDGLAVGSQTLEFRPRHGPAAVRERVIAISADSPAASTLLIFQAVFPFLLFAGNDKGEPIELEISGGTNVAWSLSFEYLDQVLLPALEDAFGIRVERTLLSRGWSLGKASRGKVAFRFTPVKLGETIKMREDSTYARGGVKAESGDVEEVDVSMIVPAGMHESLTESLVTNLEALFPGAEVNFKVIEDSGADSRIYVLLVAKSGSVRWGRDILDSTPKANGKGKGRTQTTSLLSETISRRVSKELYEEVSTGGAVDEFLQDQLVIFQALAEGRTSFRRSSSDEDGSNGTLEGAMKILAIGDERRMRRDKTDQPFGEGSLHTTTARWVTAQLLPGVAWYNEGTLCEGVGMHMEPAGRTR
ncbi:hypothetical protein VTK26DRAFT_2013 [Humicola hyalothermophila]